MFLIENRDGGDNTDTHKLRAVYLIPHGVETVILPFH